MRIANIDILDLDMGDEYVAPLTAISVYTRSQALADGVLVDVSKLAIEAGFVIPVAATAALWSDISTIPADVSWQDITGRLWDVLWMAFCAIKSGTSLKCSGMGSVRFLSESCCLYQVILYTEEGQFVDGGEDLPHYAVKMVIGPGDDCRPVITLMCPEED